MPKKSKKSKSSKKSQIITKIKKSQQKYKIHENDEKVRKKSQKNKKITKRMKKSQIKFEKITENHQRKWVVIRMVFVLIGRWACSLGQGWGNSAGRWVAEPTWAFMGGF